MCCSSTAMKSLVIFQIFQGTGKIDILLLLFIYFSCTQGAHEVLSYTKIF